MFVKKLSLQRRNPLKYTRNPNKVQGFTMGTKNYVYQEKWSGSIPGEFVDGSTDAGVTAFGGQSSGMKGLRETILGNSAFRSTQSPWLETSRTGEIDQE